MHCGYGRQSFRSREDPQLIELQPRHEFPCAEHSNILWMEVCSSKAGFRGERTVNDALKYAAAGVVNTGVGYGVFWIALRGLNLSPETANAIGYVVALSIAFLLNRFFVFTGARISWVSATRFLIGFAVAFALNQLVLLLLVRFYLVQPEIAQLFAMAIYTVSFYAINKYFVFATTATRTLKQ